MKIVKNLGIDFYTGVPDSQLKPLCDFVYNEFGIGKKHIIASNEGASVGLAAGHYLSTGKPSLVYMQNSGIGNAVNPICSLINSNVYSIPMLFVIGWRGEPGINDEPQHIFQGKITLDLLKCLNIEFFIISPDTAIEELESLMSRLKMLLEGGKQFAFIIRKNAFQYDKKVDYSNNNQYSREDILESIVDTLRNDDIVVSTTGKLSRELFEIREKKNQQHNCDFLTVGSMGHASMIALGIALEKPNRRVFCLDGDGACLMHMGSLCVIGSLKPKNYIHININNGAHETVGGMPIAKGIDFCGVARSSGYTNTKHIVEIADLQMLMNKITEKDGPLYVDVLSNIESRKDLGRPTTTPFDNRNKFMEYLRDD